MPINICIAKTFFSEPKQRPAMFIRDALGRVNQLVCFFRENFCLQTSCLQGEPGKEFWRLS